MGVFSAWAKEKTASVPLEKLLMTRWAPDVARFRGWNGFCKVLYVRGEKEKPQVRSSIWLSRGNP